MDFFFSFSLCISILVRRITCLHCCRLYRAYEKLFASMHDKGTGPHKTQFRRDENYGNKSHLIVCLVFGLKCLIFWLWSYELMQLFYLKFVNLLFWSCLASWINFYFFGGLDCSNLCFVAFVLNDKLCWWSGLVLLERILSYGNVHYEVLH